MKPVELKIARIGNSKGIRVPAATLRRYGIHTAVIMEERSDGIMLRAVDLGGPKLSWVETALEMGRTKEDWSALDVAIADGLESLAWESAYTAGVAAQEAKYKKMRPRRELRRYGVHWADLETSQGAEMAKKRPVVIVSLDVLNEQLETVTVCPLTTGIHPHWRSRQQVRIGRRNAEIAIDQIRTISKNRIGAKIGDLSPDEACLLRRIITEMYGE